MISLFSPKYNSNLCKPRDYVPVNSKTAHPPPTGQSLGIWLVLSSVQWRIWPKMRPAWCCIWLKYQNVCQQSETKEFRNSLIQHVSCVHRSLFLSIPHGFFCRFISLVISWNMPFFKVWREDKLNKKFVVAENFAKLVSKGKRFCLYSLISWVHGMTGWGIWPSLKL